MHLCQKASMSRTFDLRGIDLRLYGEYQWQGISGGGKKGYDTTVTATARIPCGCSRPGVQPRQLGGGRQTKLL